MRTERNFSSKRRLYVGRVLERVELEQFAQQRSIAHERRYANSNIKSNGIVAKASVDLNLINVFRTIISDYLKTKNKNRLLAPA